MNGRTISPGTPDTEAPEDNELVQRICSGETELFRILVERYQRRIFFMGRRFFSKPEDVEDYVQEVFLRVFEKLDTFSGSDGGGTSSFAGWLYTLAYRHAVNTLRAHRRIREDFFAEIVTSAPQDTEEELVRADTIGRVQAVLEKLPGLYALLIRLKYYEGFTLSRISEITGLPVGTVKSHLHRCRKVLKRSMQGMEGGKE